MYSFFVIYSCSKWSVKMNVSIFIWLLHIFCSINQFEVSTSIIIQIASCKLHAPLYTVRTWHLTYWYLQFFPKPGLYWSMIKSHGNNIIVSHVYIITCIIYLASCKGMGWGGGGGGLRGTYIIRLAKSPYSPFDGTEEGHRIIRFI